MEIMCQSGNEKRLHLATDILHYGEGEAGEASAEP